MSSSSPELPDGTPPITQWTRDLANPDLHQAAAARLWEKYHRLLEWRIADLIGEEMRGKVGEESVVQETLDTFFRRRASGQYDIADRNKLQALLSRIAYNKFCSRVRHETNDPHTPGQAEAKKFAAEHGTEDKALDAENVWEANVASQDLEAVKKPVFYPDDKLKRNYRKALPIDSDSPPDSEYERAEATQFLNDLEPVAQATYAEAFETLPDDLRPVLRLALQGFNNDEIAEQLGIEPGAVVRRRKRIEEHLLPRIK